MKLEVDLPDSCVDWLETQAKKSGLGLDAFVAALLARQLDIRGSVRSSSTNERTVGEPERSRGLEGEL